jgi:hypothetical protein
MENHIIANLYADWHTPEQCWTWGDTRIFITGTKGKAEVRLNGDPLIANEELLLIVTNDNKLASCPLIPVQGNLTENFIERAQGRSTSGISSISHQDILMASAATIEADRKVVYVAART